MKRDARVMQSPRQQRWRPPDQNESSPRIARQPNWPLTRLRRWASRRRRQQTELAGEIAVSWPASRTVVEIRGLGRAATATWSWPGSAPTPRPDSSIEQHGIEPERIRLTVAAAHPLRPLYPDRPTRQKSLWLRCFCSRNPWPELAFQVGRRTLIAATPAPFNPGHGRSHFADPAMMKPLLVGTFVAVVVLTECLFAYFLIPSTADVEKWAQGQGRGHAGKAAAHGTWARRRAAIAWRLGMGSEGENTPPTRSKSNWASSTSSSTSRLPI